ncbi:MAG TPA: DMT family transporter [Candidatus Eisenbacteria bacterium]|nr:DMT family transporter [Candidatus Eisenbacteria bacterium]
MNQLLSCGTHLIARGVLFVLPPITVAMLRFLAASAVFLGWFGIRPSRARIERRDWPSFLLLGFLAVTVNQGCFLFGLARSTASHAALLYALTPLVVLLLARRLLHEERFGAKLVGTLVAFLGVALILLERGLKNEAEVLKGDLLILVAVVAWSGYTILSKRLLRRYDAMTVTGWAIITGTALSLPALLVPGAIPRLASISLASWGSILYLAVATSVIAYPLWNYALRYMEASKVAIATNLQPILTAVASWLLFGERFTSGFVIGAILILAGVTWVQTRGSTTERAAAVPVEAG